MRTPPGFGRGELISLECGFGNSPTPDPTWDAAQHIRWRSGERLLAARSKPVERLSISRARSTISGHKGRYGGIRLPALLNAAPLIGQLISAVFLVWIAAAGGAHRAHNPCPQQHNRNRDHPTLRHMRQMAHIRHARDQDQRSKRIQSKRHREPPGNVKDRSQHPQDSAMPVLHRRLNSRGENCTCAITRHTPRRAPHGSSPWR